MLKTDEALAFALSVSPHMRAARIGHVIEAIAFGPSRQVSCSCGEAVDGHSDAAMAEAFRVHRRDSPPDTSRMAVRPGSGRIGIRLPGSPDLPDRPTDEVAQEG